MTLMKAKKPLALLLALLAALSLLGTTALAAGLPEETIAAQTELCGEDCGHRRIPAGTGRNSCAGGNTSVGTA